MRRPPLPWLPVRRVVLRPPNGAVESLADIAYWGYLRARDLTLARAEHARFAEVLGRSGAEVWVDISAPSDAADACFVCDPALPVPGGVVMLRFGKAPRRAEAPTLRGFLEARGVAILGAIEAPGTVEGGDCLWLDEHTLAVGEGYRTNPAGIEQLRALLSPLGCQLLVVPLPHWHGPDACMHLQSLLSFVAPRLCVAHLPLCPVRLVRALEERQVEILAAAPEEFERLGTNLMVGGVGEVIISGGLPQTAALLRRAGLDVVSVEADDLMWIATGGPTCLSLVLERG